MTVIDILNYLIVKYWSFGAPKIWGPWCAPTGKHAIAISHFNVLIKNPSCLTRAINPLIWPFQLNTFKSVQKNGIFKMSIPRRCRSLCLYLSVSLSLALSVYLCLCFCLTVSMSVLVSLSDWSPGFSIIAAHFWNSIMLMPLTLSK